jgi:hypothetical protein
MNLVIRLSIAFFALAMGASSHACSCLKLEFFVQQEEWAVQMFDRSEFVAHVRVDSLLPRNSARIHVIEKFKGGADVEEIKALRSTNEVCYPVFSEGEEFVVMVNKGVVSYCGKLELSDALVGALRIMAAR